MMMLIFAYFLTSEKALWELWLYAFNPRKSSDELKGTMHVLQKVDSTDFNQLHPFP
jgi:hypothetical protein